MVQQERLDRIAHWIGLVGYSTAMIARWRAQYIKMYRMHELLCSPLVH
jgi:hypothetical protein